jgi:hypothetical protein
MRNYRIVIVLAVAVAFLAAAAHFVGAEEAAKAETAAKAPTYIGTKACGMCHQKAAKGEILEKWQASAHAKAFTNIPTDKKADKSCWACHTTGGGKASGYAPDHPKAAELEGVGCESCHGAGSEYKSMPVMKDPAKAKAAGLVTPDEKTCLGCHAGTVPEGHKALPKFDFATAKVKIEHKIPKAK